MEQPRSEMARLVLVKQMNEQPKSAIPIDLEEYPEFKSSYTRVLTNGGYLTLISIIVSGYLVYFGLLEVSDMVGAEQIAAVCSTCASRYHDLQRFDGVSGDVYITVALLSSISMFLLAGALMLTYASARRCAGEHIPLKIGAGRQVMLTLALLIGLSAVTIFIPTELSTTRYPGSAQLLAGSTYPILAGFCVVGASLAMANIGVFCFKLLKF